MSENKKEKKIVRASDTSIIKRFVKKHFGTTYLKEMTDKQLQDVRDKPDSVFGKLKRIGNVDSERARRKYLLDKSYKDKVLRDHSKMLKRLERDKFIDKLYKKEQAKKSKKQKLAGGGLATKKYANFVVFTNNLKK